MAKQTGSKTRYMSTMCTCYYTHTHTHRREERERPSYFFFFYNKLEGRIKNKLLTTYNKKNFKKKEKEEDEKRERERKKNPLSEL